jgi:tetratricopeptide (TPR) repeat protein
MNNNHNFYQSVTNLIQNNQVKHAIKELSEFLDDAPDDETALSLLSSAYMRNGDGDKAIEISKMATKKHPNSFAAHADLGFLSMKLKNDKQAISSFEKAADLNKNLYPAWAFLEKLYFDNKQYPQALKALEEAEKNDPYDGDYRKMQQSMSEGNIAKAEQIARSMLQKQPGHPRAGFMLAYIASTVEAHEQRAEILSHCLAYHPANQILRKELIKSLEELGEYKQALQEAETLVTTEKSYINYWVLSRVYGHLADHEGALKTAEKASELVSDNDEERGKVDLLRGHALKILGRREESEKAYQSCIKNTPKNGAGWWGLADLKNYKFSDDDKDVMEKLADNESAEMAQRCQAAFALAKAYENDKQSKKAFEWYKRANDLRPDIEFDPKKNKDFGEKLRSVFNHKMFKTIANLSHKAPIPIFIVGMPRAGSTLIEQILSSHSQIEGTMELPTLPKLERLIKIFGGKKFQKHYPESLQYFSVDELSNFGDSYIERTNIYRTGKSYFIDKLPPNFEKVGLIHKIMPQAIIIDARRHPMDCGYSAFKQHFAAGHEYSYKLENIGDYYNDYLLIMDHWDKVLPGKVLCVQYEDVVHKTEEMVRKILDHIGVEFEESCLRFFENKRAVKTASSEQVRQPIYTKGIGQWKPVEKELAPLIKSLGSETLARFEKYLPVD